MFSIYKFNTLFTKSMKFLLQGLLLLILTSCFVQKPKVNRGISSDVTFDHQKFSTKNCSECHEVHRPIVKITTGNVAAIHGVGQDCKSCHLFDGDNKWLSLINFKHTPESTASCIKCHDSKRPLDPHPVSGDCVSCHTYSVWKNVKNFDHPADLTSCNACHDDGSSPFALAKKGRPDKPHPQAARDCINCHTSSKWKPLKNSFDHLPKPPSCKECHRGGNTIAPKLGRPVANGHPQSGACINCHVPAGWKKVISIDHADPGITSCSNCHASKRPSNPHPASGDCITCHSFPLWKSLKQYNHSPTPASCNGCHDGNSSLAPTQKGRPPAPHPQGGRDCNDCHSYPSWSPVPTFDHIPNPQSCSECHQGTNANIPKLGRPSRGDHPQGGECVGCHTYKDWSVADIKNFSHIPSPLSCLGCHDKQPNSNIAFKGRPGLPHPAAGDCVTCHTFPSWKPPVMYKHNPKPTSCNKCHESKSSVALKQKGRPGAPHPQGARDCIDCHDYPAWKPAIKFDHNPTPPSCKTCHENKSPLDYKQKGRPSLPHPVERDCNECHAYDNWIPKSFDHLPIPTTCSACHAGKDALAPKQKGPPGLPHPLGRDCTDCHTYPQWSDRTKSFDHLATPQTCVECHSGINQLAPKKGRPPLPHTQTGDCVDCHSFNDWKAIASFTHNPSPSSCLSCHGSRPANVLEQKGRPDLPHPAAGDCVSCHTFPNWNNVTSWPHTPAPASCNECHNDNSSQALSNKGRPAAPHPQNDRDCVDCHNYPNWKPAISYDHVPAPATCNLCHNSRSALENVQKGRPISPHPAGNRDCVDCHTNPNWTPPMAFDHNPTPLSCNACHDGKLVSAPKQKGRPPAPHPQAGRDCVDCHAISVWKPARKYDHNPLPANCSSCHSGSNSVLPKLGRPIRSDHPPNGDCNLCHTYNDWSKVTNFNHAGATSCNSCHENVRPLIPHPQTTDCINCHSNPAWIPVSSNFNHSPTPASCNACHETSNRMDRPLLPHPANRDCSECHTPVAWEPVATFDHLPEPSSCQNCHTGKDNGGDKRGRPVAPHPATGDCKECHQYVANTWTPIRPYNHNLKPSSCNKCHYNNRSNSGDHNYPTESTGRGLPNPPSYNASDPNSPGTRHYAGKDCIACHKTPAEGGSAWSFSHSTPRATSCLPCHYSDKDPDDDDGEVWSKHGGGKRDALMSGFGNCYNCHNQGKSWDR